MANTDTDFKPIDKILMYIAIGSMLLAGLAYIYLPAEKRIWGFIPLLINLLILKHPGLSSKEQSR